MNIFYKLPLNFKEEDRKIFKFDYKYLGYQDQDQDITFHKNVFVNHYGLVLKKNKLIDGCAPNIICSNYDSNFYYKHWLKITEQFLVCKYGKSLKSINLEDDVFFLIHSPWFSYYFWVTECIPRLLSVYENYQGEILIYPDFFDDFSFVRETILLFPDLRVKRISRDHHIFVKNLLLPKVKPWTIMFRPKDVLKTNNLLLRNSVVSKMSKRICIARNGTHRSFENYSEIEKLLSEYNFEFIKMESYSFFEQIGIMQNAEIVMGISGAGHTNIHFMKSGSKFLDITAKKNIERKKYKFHFWKLACIIGVEYYYQFATISNLRKDIPYYNRNIIVNLKELELNINKMLK